MLKLLVFIRRRDDLSPEAFERHLRETHAPLVARLPGLRRLVLNRVQPDPTGAAPPWSLIAEDWFDGPEALQAALASPEGQAVQADAPNFLDQDALQFLVAVAQEVPLGSTHNPRGAGE
jgi:uncharacterized protein (TIGR02118 family)